MTNADRNQTTNRKLSGIPIYRWLSMRRVLNARIIISRKIWVVKKAK